MENGLNIHSISPSMDSSSESESDSLFYSTVWIYSKRLSFLLAFSLSAFKRSSSVSFRLFRRLLLMLELFFSVGKTMAFSTWKFGFETLLESIFFTSGRLISKFLNFIWWVFMDFGWIIDVLRSMFGEPFGESMISLSELMDSESDSLVLLTKIGLDQLKFYRSSMCWWSNCLTYSPE